MKKILLFLVLCLMLSVNSFAATVDNTTDGAGTALELADLTVGVSPGVFAYYIDDTNTGNVQWWGIATAHQGGTKLYAAAQNNSGTFTITQTGGSITGPLTVAGGDDAGTYALPTQPEAASDTYWSDSDWTR